MRMASLEAYGAHPDLLAVWTQHYNEDLLPIQEKAVLDGQVLKGESVVGSGPTGCGKTLIAEMAATHAASQGRRAFYLCPTRALAEAVHRQFSRLYAPLGMRVLISTQERRQSDRRILRGEFDIAVTVPEKLWAMLMTSSSLLQTVGALVVDELQMLGDEDRGPCLELLLARFAGAGHAQIVGLSAVLGNPRELADWLGARLVEEHRRPVPMRKGVWRDGVFSYLEHNSQSRGEESIEVQLPEDASELEATVRLATELALRDEPTLVFLRDRASTVRAARMAAEQMERACASEPDRPTGQSLEAVRDLPPTQAARALAELMGSGVGFHNADLHLSERHLVEAAFASGDLRCLFATSTLAVGLNLPARNVIVEPLKWRSLPGGQPSLGPLTQAEFENMAGRAGRLGFGDEYGRALLVGEAGFAEDGLLRRYVEAPPEPVNGQFERLPAVQRLLLRTAAEGLDGEPLHLLTPTPSTTGDTAEEARAIDRAEKAGLILHSPFGDRLALTGAGQLAATCGLSLTTVASMTAALERLHDAPSDLEAVVVAALSTEARAVPLPRDRSEGHWMRLLEARGHSDCGWSERTRALLWSGPLRAAERETAARIALTALDWSREEDTADLELRTGLHSGRAAILGETIGWLVQCLARMVEERGGDPDDVDRLQELGESLTATLPPACLPLHRLHVPSLQRDHVLALAGAGMTSRDDLAAAAPGVLESLLPPSTLAELSQMIPLQVEVAPSGPEEEHTQETAVAGPLLVIDAGRPNEVSLRGQVVALRPMEFELLSLLAHQPQRCVPFDKLYNELWGANNPVEPAQIYYHRHNLARKLMSAMPEGSEPIVKTISRRGLMLDLPAEAVAA
jgi:helicase